MCCEAEYIALPDSLLEVKPIMALLDEMKSYGFDVVSTEPTTVCTVIGLRRRQLGRSRTRKNSKPTSYVEPNTSTSSNIMLEITSALARSRSILSIKSEDHHLAGVLTKPPPLLYFQRICQQNLCSSTNQEAHSTILEIILSLSATGNSREGVSARSCSS